MTKILIVTTSHERFGDDHPLPTGVWLEEFAVPYMEFLNSGIEMTIASPKGGAIPIDPRSNPTPEQAQVWQTAIEAGKHTVQLSAVEATEFDAIFLPGGHGPMFDLPENQDLQQLLRDFYEADKLIAAVCHGPAGLVGATLADGTPLVKDKILTAYTYSEEVAANLDQLVPFILEHRLRELGADFTAHADQADHVEYGGKQGKLITGQNPNSSASIARAIVAALTQQLPPIFANAPEAIAPAQTIAEFPINTFLENITVAANGNLFITRYEAGKIYRVTPSGTVSEYAKIPSSAAGLAFDRQGNLLVAGLAEDKTPTLFRINPDAVEPIVEPIVALPDAIFLNGMTHLADDRYLIADSYKGAIWEVNTAAKTVQIWVQHERLARSDANHPFPAVNGLKIYGNTLYASNTQRQQLIRIPIDSNSTAGTPDRWLTNVNLDDFAFDVSGNLYATTHVYNSVVRIAPDGQITTLAKAEQGVAGCTALAFGQAADDQTCLYITTNGGMSLPLPTGLESAKVVRLDVGIKGWSTHEK